jgi:2-C-methyl-D-erythritol 4-phosphate cytidylyltransferase
MHLSVIIVAAGSSVRMGFDKLAAPLAGKPVLQHALEAFQGVPASGLRPGANETPPAPAAGHPSLVPSEIILVCSAERFGLLDLSASPIPIRRAEGGADRHHSVASGLAALSPAATHVAVHDGARPLLHPEDFARCVTAAVACGAAALARRVAETLKRSDDAGFCTGSVSRENLWLMETPQISAAPLLREAYAAVLACGLTVTDEVSAIQETGHAVRFVESLHPNPKITRPADLALAEAILARP